MPLRPSYRLRVLERFVTRGEEVAVSDSRPQDRYETVVSTARFDALQASGALALEWAHASKPELPVYFPASHVPQELCPVWSW